jgi:hypothetical protein
MSEPPHTSAVVKGTEMNTDHLAAYNEPPSVRILNGEVVLEGPGVCAAYTGRAATHLLEQLKAALATERVPPSSVAHLPSSFSVL